MLRLERDLFFGVFRPGAFALSLLILVFSASFGFAAETNVLSPELKAFRAGNYSEAVRLAERSINSQLDNEESWRTWIDALLMTGQYTTASNVVVRALERFSLSIPMLLTAHEVYRQNDARNKATEILAEINDLVSRRGFAYRDSASMVALGRTALLLGADPRRVLENFFDRVKRTDPQNRDVYLASGQVAFEKHDYALAAKTFGDALKKFPKDADFLFGLAQSFESSDRREMLTHLDAALGLNSNHVASLLLLVDHLVDSEQYDDAEDYLVRVLKVNPWNPSAWSYRAVLAALRNKSEAETEAREKALRYWKRNPSVDWLIGRKMSQKYRFAEGSASQRRALAFDPEFLPAKVQLAQDLLRLGKDDEGWPLVESVHEADPYDVTAYNLVTLKETLSKYRSITNEAFIVRMTAKEADIYGAQVLDLLNRAKTNLCEKYGLQFERPTTVEIFDKQKDFAVRTFGMPGNPGFLGVCFGFVVTANSPASQAPNPANWQAVLWHEFCHVITLQLTRNRIPRWLSEGISVYEERQADSTWGQTMTPTYREMVLGEDLAPISKLSGSFLAPKTPGHLQFAYYQASLVVEFLIERYGVDALRNILRDLGTGAEINKTIAAHTVAMDELEPAFVKFAHDRAEKLAPDLDWEKPPKGGAIPPQWITSHPMNFYALRQDALALIREKKWQDAKKPLARLIEAYPEQNEPGNAYVLLAAAHRNLGETNLERKTLQTVAALSGEDWESFSRLCELAVAEKDWGDTTTNGLRLLAVNPLIPQPYRYLGMASEALQKPNEAVNHYSTVLRLDPSDPAEIHFKLARILHAQGNSKSKHHVLQALEEAPRFRDAHRLLLQMDSAKDSTASPPKTVPPADVP